MSEVERAASWGGRTVWRCENRLNSEPRTSETVLDGSVKHSEADGFGEVRRSVGDEAGVGVSACDKSVANAGVDKHSRKAINIDWAMSVCKTLGVVDGEGPGGVDGEASAVRQESVKALGGC